MKIRKGFVSNSSSSSFLIKTDESVFDIALKMLEMRNCDWADLYSEDELYSEINAIKKSKLDENTPVCFNTTNYKTYIIKKGSVAAIATCNNHSFWSLFDKCNVSFDDLKDAKEMIEFYNGNKPVDIGKFKMAEFLEDMEYELCHKGKFWYPRYNIFRKIGNNRCEKHYEKKVR